MAYEYDRFEREDGGGSFLMGLLAGTVLGRRARNAVRAEGRRRAAQPGLGAGGTAADDGQRRVSQATEKVSQIVDKGREAYDRARTSGGFNVGSQGGSSTGGNAATTGGVGAGTGTGGGYGAGGYGSDRG